MISVMAFELGNDLYPSERGDGARFLCGFAGTGRMIAWGWQP
jgi:hypothetical protein